MSEKNTDHFMQCEYEKVFNHMYNTEGNNELFNSKFPDGWKIYNEDKILIIIENKKSINSLDKAKNQIQEYYNNLPDDIKKEYKIYLIIGLGNSLKSFKYYIYNRKFDKINLTLQDIKNKMNFQEEFDEKEIHKFNQYLYDNGILLNKNQKTLFVSSLLLSLKIDKDFIKDYDIKKPGFIIADKIIELIDKGYNDPIFTSQFKFISKSLKNKYLYDLINIIYIDIKKYGKDILNKFYNEFRLYDKNDDNKLGVVLTPHDIIEIMVKELNINKDDIILDFCTGTGSFLLESSKYSKNLIGCEYNEERYALCKCNFILNDLDYNNLYYNSCFNQVFPKCDKSIINPPFSCKCLDEDVEENETNWKNYKKEQRFLLYQVQCLKIGGIGACIIPRNNFNNSQKKINDFKKELLKYIKINKIICCNSKVFAPIALVECDIIIYERINKIKNVNKLISKNVEVIDYSNDGYKIKDKLRIKEKEHNIKSQIRDLNYNDDWNYEKSIYEQLPNYNILNLIEQHKKAIEKIQNDIKNLENKLFDDIDDNIEYEECLLSDIIEPIKYKTYTYDKCEDGDIPFYVASKFSNPKGYKNVISIDCEKLKLDKVLCINRSGEGVIGYCHIRTGKFGCNALVGCYKLLKDLNESNLNFLQYQLILHLNHHFRSFNLNDIKIMKIYLLPNNIEYINNNIVYEIINNNYKVKEWKKLKISDYFELAKPKKTFTINKSIEGEYPLITRSNNNNGISKFINDYSFDGEYITIAPSGSTGSCFYHSGKFAVDGQIKTFKSKDNNNIDLNIWALMINYYLTKKYSYTNGLTINKILNEEINIPIFEE